MNPFHSVVRLAAVAVLAATAAACAGGAKETAKAKSPAFEVHAYTASPDAWLVSSYAVVSGDEILLVDAQMLNTEAAKFIEMVKRIPARPSVLFLTHAHPDHYLALEQIVAAFPGVKVMATAETVAEIQASGAGTLQFFREKFMDGALKTNLSTKVLTPKKLEGNTLKVGTTTFEVLAFPMAEAKHANALWHAESGTLISGDLAFNKVHLWLRDTPPAGWITALEALKAKKVKKVYPGHGEPGGAEVLDRDLAYLRDFDESVKASANAESLATKVKTGNPDMRVPMIVDFAAPAYYPAAKPDTN